MSRFLVVITDWMHPPADIEQEVCGEDFEIRVLGKSQEEDLYGHIEQADALMVWHDITIGRETIERLERCRAIVRYGVGFDNVDLAAAGKRGIQVCNIPDYGTNDVADHTLGLILALRRGLLRFNDAIQRGNEGWHWKAAGTLHRLTGQALGIIGLGRIGTAVSMRAKPFGLNVVFYDPYVSDGMDKALGVERLELDELLARADVVSLHTPLTYETHQMANEAFFSRLKPGAILINTARGPIVALDALFNALRDGRVSGAGLDVLPQEPPDPDHPLIRAWRADEEWLRGRLIITPHSAFYNEEAHAELRTKAAQEVKRLLLGQPPRNCVNQAWLNTAPLVAGRPG